MILTIRRTALCGLAAALLGVLVEPERATADTVIDTHTGWNGTDFSSPFGYPDTATYGQTITAPGAATSWKTSRSTSAACLLDFKGYVYAWDSVNKHATGSALFTSPTISVTNSSTYDPITFNTGGLAHPWRSVRPFREHLRGLRRHLGGWRMGIQV